MADKKKQKLTPEAQDYQQIQKQREIKRSLMKNCLKAFIVGGSICLLGQVISTFYMHFFDFTELTVGNPTISILIIVTMLLNGFVIYDHFGRFAGACTAVRVTVFANAVISLAIEYRTEWFVLGVSTIM